MANQFTPMVHCWTDRADSDTHPTYGGVENHYGFPHEIVFFCWNHCWALVFHWWSNVHILGVPIIYDLRWALNGDVRNGPMIDLSTAPRANRWDEGSDGWNDEGAAGRMGGPWLAHGGPWWPKGWGCCDENLLDGLEHEWIMTFHDFPWRVGNFIIPTDFNSIIFRGVGSTTNRNSCDFMMIMMCHAHLDTKSQCTTRY